MIKNFDFNLSKNIVSLEETAKDSIKNIEGFINKLEEIYQYFPEAYKLIVKDTTQRVPCNGEANFKNIVETTNAIKNNVLKLNSQINDFNTKYTIPTENLKKKKKYHYQ